MSLALFSGVSNAAAVRAAVMAREWDVAVMDATKARRERDVGVAGVVALIWPHVPGGGRL